MGGGPWSVLKGAGWDPRVGAGGRVSPAGTLCGKAGGRRRGGVTGLGGEFRASVQVPLDGMGRRQNKPRICKGICLCKGRRGGKRTKGDHILKGASAQQSCGGKKLPGGQSAGGGRGRALLGVSTEGAGGRSEVRKVESS